MKVILWLLRELGVKEVPSFDGLRKTQKLLQERQGIPTINWMTPKGNAFSFNDPITLIANVSTRDTTSRARLHIQSRIGQIR
jgi:hypothetical protein